MLIPAYKDMDPYDLPEEFSHLQAQDMSRLGFMQDLIRGIKKIIQIDEPKTAGNKETLATGNNVNIAPLLKRAVMFLEDCDWRSANEYCEKVLDIDPECAEAYLGKLMVDLKVRNKDDLQKQDNLFANNKNYQKALRFADDSLKKSLTDIIQKQIILKEELEIKAEAERLEQERKAEAERLEQERKAEAERLEHERKVEAEKLERKQKTELARKEAERISRRNKKIAVIIISIICLVFVTAAFIIPAGSYKIAINSKNYNEAYEDLYSMLIRPKNGLSELQNELIKNCSVGQIVNFGFTGNGLRSSDIQWLVLEIKDDKALLLLNELLPEYERFLYSDSWETSDIREELNSQFYNTHFTAANKSIIELSTISADNNPDYETAPGNNTQDKVFLLSIEEALRYFPTDKTRKFQNSWWLRTPGSTSGRFSYVNSIGTINTNGTASKLYIRPAIWVNIGD